MLAVLAAVLAACDAAVVGTVQPTALEADPEAAVGVTASPSPATSARRAPAPEPTATPPPEPPKPSGVTFDWYNEVIEGAPGDMAGVGDFILTVRWKKPRRKGAEIRVYGVTKCFEKGTDDSCLRKRTPLPADIRVLVARAPASKGSVTFRLPLGDHGEWSKDGRQIYSFVIAAYNESGHSIFEIVEPGSACGSRVRQCDTY
jgi:hypothetical protein